jgi:2-iminobutanoate/2-iminopropanoate deaminase
MKSARRREFKLPELGPAISHYTDAVAWGDLLFVSGIVAIDKEMRLVGGEDVALQAGQIFDNLKLILDAVGASFGDVLKVTLYLTDIVDRTKINPVRRTYFGSARPASTLVQVAALAVPGAKLEIEAVVGLSGQK